MPEAKARQAMIRLASSLPKGSEERKTILAAIPTQAAQDLRDPQDMKLWYKWWSQASDGFGKGLAGAIASGPAKISYRDEGTITLNYGPVFGVRYISMGIRGGGSTAPNPDYPPEFTVIVDLSSSSRVKAWPGLPVSKMEQEVVEVVSNLAKKELGRIGRAKVRASRGKYWSVSVSLDPNMSLAGTGSPLADVASATIQTLGSKIGKAVNRVLVAYQQEYEASREKRIDGLESEVESTQVRRELMWDKADSLMVARDTDPYAEDEAEELRSEAYQMGIQIIRLQEQLSGITGKNYKKPEFRKQAGAGMNQDRKSLIRLASALPKGSRERKVILAGLEKTKTAYLTGEADYFFGWAKDLCWYIADALRSTPMSTMRKAPDGEIVVVREKPSRSAVAGNGREKGGEQGKSVEPRYENHIYLWDQEGNKYTLRFYSYITRNPDTFHISLDGGQEAGTAIGVDVNRYDSPRVAWTALRRAIAKASASKRLRPYSRTGPHVEIK